jgi:hypothetical protein
LCFIVVVICKVSREGKPPKKPSFKGPPAYAGPSPKAWFLRRFFKRLFSRMKEVLYLRSYECLKLKKGKIFFFSPDIYGELK